MFPGYSWLLLVWIVESLIVLTKVGSLRQWVKHKIQKTLYEAPENYTTGIK